MLWKPKPGATATAEEFIAARMRFVEINRDGNWSPWVLDWCSTSARRTR